MPLQRWWPDTCGCCIEQRHGEGNGVQFERVVEKCAVHTSVPDAQLYGVLYENQDGENKRKNHVEYALVSDPIIGLGTLGPSGHYEWKPGVGFNWSWSGSGSSRVIEVTVYGVNLNGQKKARAQSWCDTRFGAGKVLVL